MAIVLTQHMLGLSRRATVTLLLARSIERVHWLKENSLLFQSCDKQSKDKIHSLLPAVKTYCPSGVNTPPDIISQLLLLYAHVYSDIKWTYTIPNTHIPTYILATICDKNPKALYHLCRCDSLGFGNPRTLLATKVLF